MTIDLKELFAIEDDKFATVLLKALKSASDSSFDYLKFKQSVAQLMELGMDKNKAIQSTFATASTIGLNKKSLLKSSEKYIKTLEKEKRTFAEALVRQQKERVNKKNEMLGTYAKEVNLHKNKIAQLKKEIELYEQKITELQSEIDGEAGKITQTRDQFMAAYERLDKVIKEDTHQIDQLL